MIPIGLFGPLGIWEILLILVIAVFLFGARRIPDVARGLGEGIRGFRAALRGDEETGADGDDPVDKKKG